MLSARKIVTYLALLATAAKAEPRTTPVAGYYPELTPAVVACVMYGVVALIHIAHYVKFGRLYMLTLCIGMTTMTAGYAARAAYTFSPLSLGGYVASELFTVLSPCLFLATVYMVLARFCDHVGPEIYEQALFLPKKLIVRGFVWSDGITFFLQASGSGLAVSPERAQIGKYIALIGLIIQGISFALFTCVMLVFVFRVRSRFPHLWLQGGSKTIAPAWTVRFGGIRELDWRVLFAGLSVSAVGILIRSVFRIVEYAQGYYGYLRTHEGFLYLLDALPLWLAMTVFAAVWPTLFMMPAPSHSILPMQIAPSQQQEKYRSRA